jgi:nucleoside-diphosphate-sugar epimerase
MKILMTGGFGNVGAHALRHAVNRGYDVTVFDVQNERNQKVQAKLSAELRFNTQWGDLRQAKSVQDAISAVQPDAIVHIAAIIAPTAYVIPDVAYDVNVNGMKHLIKAAEGMAKQPKVVFASSYGVYDYRNPFKNLPPLTGDIPVAPIDNYGSHKVAGERLLHASTLDWTVLRLPVIMSLDSDFGQAPQFMKFAFLLPLDRREHVLDARDAALALVNAVEANTAGKTYTLGGPESDCRVTGRDLMRATLDARGLPMLPEELFRKGNPDLDHTWSYEDWVDTSEPQRVLQFQEHTFAQYLSDVRANPVMRFAMRLIAPLAVRQMQQSSPVVNNPNFDHDKTTWELICETFELDPNTRLTFED